MYDPDDMLVQYYFDITGINYISEDGEPRFTDMFVDVVIGADGAIAVLDEEELNDAYRNGVISLSEYTAAKERAGMIAAKVSGKEKALREFCSTMLKVVKEKAGE